MFYAGMIVQGKVFPVRPIGGKYDGRRTATFYADHPSWWASDAIRAFDLGRLAPGTYCIAQMLQDDEIQSPVCVVLEETIN